MDALLYDARSDNPGRPSELSGQALAELQKDLERGRWRSVPQLQRWLAQTHGVKLALSSLYDRLGKACARLRVPRKSHVKNDPAAGLEFRTELAAKLTELALPLDRPVRLWVLDEDALRTARLHPACLGPARPPSGRPHSSRSISGALSMARRARASSRTEFLLTETMDQAHSVEFYRQISRSDPAAMHVLIQDGAGFHLRDGDANLPDNVRVITLPAYGPEINPVEGLWDQIRDSLCNRVFDTLAELEAVLQTELQRFWQDACRVHSLVFDWLLAQANVSSRPIRGSCKTLLVGSDSPSPPSDGGEGRGEEARFDWDFPSPQSSPHSCLVGRGRGSAGFCKSLIILLN